MVYAKQNGGFMEKIKQKKLSLVFMIITVEVVAIIVALGIVAQSQNNNDWVLKSYNNTVALYNNDKITEIFEEIVLDTLPDADIRQLENGIVFTTRDEAIRAIEDFDG